MSLCINPQCHKLHNSDTTIFCQGCGSELLIDGRYRVIKGLGQGGFGTTYEIQDPKSNLWVLKVLMDNHPKYVELFQQEASMLKVLNHPGIPKIDIDGYFSYFCEGQSEPLHCLVMEKIEGLNLSQYINKRGNRPIKPKRALRWLAELILILEQVHKENFFHRDIKPANIMLRANGCLSLIDFGTAREITNSYIQKKESGEVTGVVTQGYTPMEQMRGKAVLQSDFYALGGTIIFLLTSENPGNFYDLTNDRICWHGAVPNLSPKFADLIDRMMAFYPTDRPQNSREIFAEILRIDSSLQILDDQTSSISASTTKTTEKISFSGSSSDGALSTSQFNSQVTPEFITFCRQELAEFIGPMANIICSRVIKNNPRISKAEFRIILAKNIADPKSAEQFQKHLIERE